MNAWIITAAIFFGIDVVSKLVILATGATEVPRKGLVAVDVAVAAGMLVWLGFVWRT